MSIVLEGVFKEYRTRHGLNPILKDVNLVWRRSYRQDPLR
jgi:hypothetical protein